MAATNLCILSSWAQQTNTFMAATNLSLSLTLSFPLHVDLEYLFCVHVERCRSRHILTERRSVPHSRSRVFYGLNMVLVLRWMSNACGRNLANHYSLSLLNAFRIKPLVTEIIHTQLNVLILIAVCGRQIESCPSCGCMCRTHVGYERHSHSADLSCGE